MKALTGSTRRVFTGQCRQKRNGQWWFCTAPKKKGDRHKYIWPIGNSSHIIKVGQVVDVTKPTHTRFCFIIIQLELF